MTGSGKFSCRQPPRSIRVLLVALVISVPGTLLGMMISPFCGRTVLRMVIASMLFLVAGAVLEGWPTPPRLDA